jgi:methyltransferase family protein
VDIKHFRKVAGLIREADQSGLLFETENLAGFSGAKVIGALQRIATYQQEIEAGCYLEVGVLQGLTLISVASVLDRTLAYGIDNFAQFDPEKKNYNVIVERSQAYNLQNIQIINADYEDALENLPQYLGNTKIATFFVDGPHDYRSQLMCLQLVRPYLSDLAVIVVDDCNYRHVRLANRDFLITNPQFKLLFETYTKCHPKNLDKNAGDEARRGWWNGVNIITYDPDGQLDQLLPPTIRDRILHENEHIVHIARYGCLAPDAISLVQSLFSLRLIKAMKQIFKLAARSKQLDVQLIGHYETLNTYSEQLQARYNSAL